MIRLADIALPDEARLGLERYQQKVDDHPDYAARVKAAKEHFSARNNRHDPVFGIVRGKLKEICVGARRCGYCEDSVADEVEHIRPKDLYPELVFVWENYLYACGPCNGPKSSKFAVIDEATGALVDVTRRRGHPVVPPQSGNPALIDPRWEDPLQFLDLDIVDTFTFLVADGLSATDAARANYTIEVLHLNDRDHLIESRHNAYGSYRARLHEYREMRVADVAPESLSALVSGLREMPHPTVWAEMKRQHGLIAELRPLFGDFPEAMEW